MKRYIVTSPTFSAFRKGEPDAFKATERALNGLKHRAEYVKLNEETMIATTKLPAYDDPFTFHVSEIPTIDITNDIDHINITKEFKDVISNARKKDKENDNSI